MGGTETSTQDKVVDGASQGVLPGQGSDAEEGSSSTPSFTEEQVQKQVSDALAKQGDKHKVELTEAIAKEREANMAAFKETQDRISAVDQKLNDLSEAGGDDAIISGLIKDTRKELDVAKTERDALETHKEAHAAEWLSKEERIIRAEETNFEIALWDLAEQYQSGDATRLKQVCEAAKITKAGEAKELADALWTKKTSGSQFLTSGTPDSGGMSGGEQTWIGIRDAYIQNPNDPRIRQAYLEARHKRNAERGL